MATRGRKKNIEITESEITGAENTVLNEFINEIKETTIEEIKDSISINESTGPMDTDETLRDDGFVLENNNDTHNDDATVIELTNEEVVLNCIQEINVATAENNSTDEATKEINIGNKENKEEVTNNQAEGQKLTKDVKPKRQTTREVFGSDVFGVVYGY